MFNIKYILQEEEGGSTPPPSGGTPPPAGGMMGGEAPPPAGGEAPPPAGWNYAEGVAGDGDRPDWFKDKYTSVEAQAKAYGDLESRFGGFTGSPDEFATPDGFGEGEAAIMAKTIQEIAKDSNMNQETFNKILETVATNVEGYRETFKQDQMQEAIKSIPNFENRRTALAETAQTVLTTTQFEGLNDLMSTTAGFEAIEALTASVRGTSLPGGQPPAQQRTPADITQEMSKLDPSDMNGRNKLIQELNAAGDGIGKLI